MQQIPEPHEIEYLDKEWLDSEGRIKLLPAATFRAVPPLHLILWCYMHARYQLPTIELVDWLKEKIGTKSAIEVGAGNGDLGHHLSIPMTDSYFQQTPEMKFYYSGVGQAPTNPRPEVEKLTASAAIKKYRPQVVIASWLTRKFIPGVDTEGQAQACFYGADEEEIILHVNTYIHIGNEAVHGAKSILQQRHLVYWEPGLISRAINPHLNCIYVWSKDND